MSSAYLANPLIFLVQTLFGLYAALVAIRFLLQWVRADFYNPLSQFVVRATAPALRPLRRLIPGYGGLDLAALLLIWALKSLELLILLLLHGYDRSPFAVLPWAVPALLQLFFNIFLFAVLIGALLSWLNPDPYNPAVALIDRLTAPLLRPARRWIRPLAGVDLSPLAVMILLIVLEMLLVPPLKWFTGSPF